MIEALGGTPPRYAHVPQVLGPDRQPLSKRHGSTSVESFREQGFLPEAIVNYLALLGWSPGDDREVLSREELVEAFDLERVSSNPAAFDTEKLTWLNNRYIQSLDDDDLAARCLHFLTEEGLMPDPPILRAAMPLVKERMKTLTEAPVLLRFLFTDDLEPNEKAAGADREGARRIPGPGGRRARCASSRGQPRRSRPRSTQLAEREGLSRTKAFQPVRAAVTASNVSPPLPESLELLGARANPRTAAARVRPLVHGGLGGPRPPGRSRMAGNPPI